MTIRLSAPRAQNPPTQKVMNSHAVLKRRPRLESFCFFEFIFSLFWRIFFSLRYLKNIFASLQNLSKLIFFASLQNLTKIIFFASLQNFTQDNFFASLQNLSKNIFFFFAPKFSKRIVSLRYALWFLALQQLNYTNK